ncbi:hypothetical protein CLAFUW4_00354 [Fulvia fulva]|uniref:Uncharacterized protein n=1 Tax=Passalora fulva TaxID=5499 RepID=A0A9Q8L8J5_PASFU|nr:uncharacterized protein CLAFUR5_00354 [Fulvia fulva]KAK4635847.1 hypothetical protein CLAFUR4_00354 [Fulvia fulva]KAK4636435.1 hypothetical protein CLAFUR0_00355 [Fulvia fulva]UJO12784.1 hypothetical protein CLAFUR5_00354 [Fulvia fulva]WPV09222.1 hypothetical protein CLAFUW4_00354 [Fulvia fulva]WPV24337.1 hypothetical protein CLAFUW7_00358 [Fulvia fulva]
MPNVLSAHVLRYAHAPRGQSLAVLGESYLAVGCSSGSSRPTATRRAPARALVGEHSALLAADPFASLPARQLSAAEKKMAVNEAHAANCQRMPATSTNNARLSVCAGRAEPVALHICSNTTTVLAGGQLLYDTHGRRCLLRPSPLTRDD